MALDRTTNRFGNREAAEGWFTRLRADWVVTGTTVEDDPVLGGVVATAEFKVCRGAVVRASVPDQW